MSFADALYSMIIVEASSGTVVAAVPASAAVAAGAASAAAKGLAGAMASAIPDRGCRLVRVSNVLLHCRYSMYCVETTHD